MCACGLNHNGIKLEVNNKKIAGKIQPGTQEVEA
jgi:hypothetical protein